MYARFVGRPRRSHDAAAAADTDVTSEMRRPALGRRITRQQLCSPARDNQPSPIQSSHIHTRVHLHTAHVSGILTTSAQNVHTKSARGYTLPTTCIREVHGSNIGQALLTIFIEACKIVKPEKEPFLGNGCVARNDGVTVESSVFCAVRSEAHYQMPPRDSLETAVRRVRGSCEKVASLRGREAGSRETFTGGRYYQAAQ
jgi:hypothetical protein